MKQSTTPYTAVFLFVFVGFSAYSQIKVKKPEINISKPKIEIGGGNSGSENEISIGKNCQIATGVIMMDSDFHGTEGEDSDVKISSMLQEYINCSIKLL